MTVIAPISGTPARLLFEETVLGRHRAKYYMDDAIGAIFVDSPNWLDEAYSSAISITDTGILERNIQNIRRVCDVLERGEIEYQRGVDLGGGYGLFVRGMRDQGHPFYWQDKYSENLVARGFEAADGKHEVAVAFEVLEHLPNPASFLIEMRERFAFETLFFTATLFDEASIPERDWWYWAFESGQHISFFSKRSLEAISEMLGMNLFEFGGDLFAFSTSDLAGVARGKTLLERLGFGRRRPPSLTFDDHMLMVERLRERYREAH